MRLVKGLSASTVTKGVAQFLDPLNYEPQRIPELNSFQSLGTAVCALSQMVQLQWTGLEDPDPRNWSTLAPTRKMLQNVSQRLVVKLRDPVVSLIVSEFGPADTPDTTSVVDVGNIANSDFITNFPTMVLAVDSEYIPIIGSRHESGYKRYPDFVPAGWNLDQSQRVMWIDGGEAQGKETIVQIRVGTGQYAVEVTAHGYTHEHAPSIFGTYSFPADSVTTVNYIINRSGYYSFSLKQVNATSAVSITIQGFWVVTKVTQWMSHYCFDSFVDSLNVIDKARVLGDALLCCNTTAEMFKSGVVYSRQPQDVGCWTSIETDISAFTNVNAREKYEGPLSKGLYATTMPQGQAPFEFREASNTAKYSAALPGFYPLQLYGYTVTLLEPSAINDAAPRATFALHHMRSVEFTTDSQMFVVRQPSIPRTDWNAMLDILSKTTQFYENPLHLADIRRALQRFGSWAWHNKSEIIQIAQLVATIARTAAA